MSENDVSADLAAMRVANRYAAMVAKAETLLDRAAACRDAADRYRSDARSNQESVENHRTAARTIRDPGVAAEHARQAGEAEAEAAREILAARYYETQAEEYEGQACAAGGTAAGGGLTSMTEVQMESPTLTPAGVVDVLGYADGDTCLGTDQVAAVAGPATTLALMDHGDGDDRWDGGRYVAVATSPAGWNPVTGMEQPAGEQPALYAAPHLDAAEADAAADHLEELADLAESGNRPPTPTKWSRATRRLEQLMDSDADLAGERVAVGDADLPVTVRDLLTLLREQDPAGAVSSTRRRVAAAAIDQAGGDTGTLWMDLVVDHDGATRVAVTGVEGVTEDPDDDYWRPYTAVHSAEQARALSDKLRTFAVAARHGISGALYLGGGDDAPYLDWSLPVAGGGRQLELGDGYGDAIALDLTAGQLRGLWDALTATIDDVPEASGAYWPDTNDTRYIDWSDADPERGTIQLEIGDGTTAVAVTLTPDQLRAWRDRLAIDLADGQ